MGDTEENSYPLATVRQYPEKIAFLIDCDGDLSEALHTRRPTVINPELIDEFPKNSDIFLFYNSNDRSIVARMEKLKSKYSNVHIFPNIIPNSPNGTDMNLSFTLGRVYNKYDSYVIIAPDDRAYGELQERLESTHPRLKNHVQLRRFEGSKELVQYVRKLSERPVEQEFEACLKARGTTSSTTVKFTSKDLFHHCPLESWQQSSLLYRFTELIDHLDDKHPKFGYKYCSYCEEMVQEDDWSEDRWQLIDKHVQKEHLDNNAGFRSSIWPW